jgi:DNA-binding GntR family transcriptional regulator
MIGVGNPYVVAGAGDAWKAEAAAAGRRGTQRLLDVRTLTPSDEVRAALALGEGELAVVRSRLMLLDDVPVEIADSFYPASLAASTPLAAPAKIKGGAVAVLASLGRAAASVIETITARLPRPDELDNLQIGPTEPLLVLMRISLDKGGLAVEYAVNRMVAGRTEPLEYRMAP